MSLTEAGSYTAAAPGRRSPSPPASVSASGPPRTQSADPADCTRLDRCCCLTGNDKTTSWMSGHSGWNKISSAGKTLNILTTIRGDGSINLNITKKVNSFHKF